MTNVQIELKKYEKQLARINEELQTLPEGRLVKRGSRYSQVLDEREIGITKDETMIRLLSRKRYLLEFKKGLNKNISILSHPISKVVDITHEKIIENLPPYYQEIPKPYFFHSTVEPWLEKSFKQNPYKEQERKYNSKNGIAVRSKSELIIANLLEDYGIPYHYDIAMKLGSKTIYPDFIIKNPLTGITILWEHFGALHQPEYEQKMNEKMESYLAHGYIPFETIIYTFEFDISMPLRLQHLIQNILINDSIT